MGIATYMNRQTAALDGILIVNKEAGWTSHDVVAKVRKITGVVKVGHAGTLDPAATGVLPVLVGRATRIAEYLLDWDKAYRAVLRLGETTDTQDATGTVLSRADTSMISDALLHETIAGFRGPQRQIPPMYSAVKVGGRPLYKAARAGQTVERAERAVMIHALDILARDGRDVTVNVVCSKGTYIRTLCADIGQVLGVGGHLCALERLRVGPLSIDQSLTVGEVAAQVAIGAVERNLVTLNQALNQLPALRITDEQARVVRHGGFVSHAGIGQLPRSVDPFSVRLQDEGGQLLAIGICDARVEGVIKVHKVLVDSEMTN
ncbi:MAG: tRNA pseudouridine(55) synthase TruB [Nitrospira sp.]|nr:tRNA pseudouridine(55) synthase TruB [Nitrospira sp.]